MVKEDFQLTEAVREALRSRIGAQRFELWFSEGARFRQGGPKTIVVEADTVLLRDWLQTEFRRDLKAVVAEICLGKMDVRFEVAENPAKTAPPALVSKQLALPLENAVPASNGVMPGSPNPAQELHQGCARVSRPRTETPASPPDELSFMSFVEGTTNRTAIRAVRACATSKQIAPLVVLWGPHGVGKTHLLRAARTEFRQHNRRGRALYLTAEQFTTGFVEAIHGRGLPSFRQKHRGVDLLLLDDVHFLSGKTATQEEFQYTLDTVASAGGRVVLTSNRGPAALGELGPEITSRLAAGIACELQWPEFDVRLGVLRSLCQRQNLELSGEVLQTLAAGISLGARELAGALNRLRVLHDVFDEPLGRPLAERVVTEINHQCTRPVLLGDIQKAVCDVFGLDAKNLKSNKRAKSVSEPRMLAMWLARKYTRAAWSEIGDYFGRRSHSTVISAHRRVEELLGQKTRIHTVGGDCDLEDAVRRVENVLRSA